MMRGGLIGFAVALMIAGTAWGQTAGADATVRDSKLAGFAFPNPAVALEDDGTYLKTLNEVGQQQHLSCGKLEAFGWSYDDKDKGQTLVNATIKAMTDSGYTIKAIAYKPFEGRQAFPGLATAKKKPQILLIWVADPAQATLVMCEAKPSKKK